MGNRRTDPWSNDLEPFCKSSPGWPDFTRILPVLDWSYGDVWKFLKEFNLPYCSLYDEGYTSLGEINNTIKNPHLKVIVNGETQFLPAFELLNEEDERESRCTKR